MLDVLITVGEVDDGTGGPPVRADVGIAGDRIGLPGAEGLGEAAVVIDAVGKAVCPGFIKHPQPLEPEHSARPEVARGADSGCSAKAARWARSLPRPGPSWNETGTA
jgi:hypothetical protein